MYLESSKWITTQAYKKRRTGRMGVSDGGDLWRFLRVRLPLIALATIVLVGLAVAHLNTTAELSCFSRLRRYVAPCHLHIAPLPLPS